MSNVTHKRHNKQSKLDTFNLDFEYNRTLKEERKALRERTVQNQ